MSEKWSKFKVYMDAVARVAPNDEELSAIVAAVIMMDMTRVPYARMREMLPNMGADHSRTNYVIESIKRWEEAE